MKLSVWVQFTWDLKTLPPETPKLNPRYTSETATLEDRPLLLAAWGVVSMFDLLLGRG